MKWRWYISISAVEQYMEIAGLRGELEDTNPDFILAQNALGELSLTAKPAPTAQTRSGAEIYRGKVTIRGQRRRIECTVNPYPRVEGDLPQLLRVRLK
ncbi:MAG: hypothetical protein ACRD1R_09065 [Acidobacteriota bacterium]